MITPYPTPELGPQAHVTATHMEALLRETLMKEQQKQAKCLLEAFLSTSTAAPRHTSLVQHAIQTTTREMVHGATQPLLCHMWDVEEQKVQAMLDLRVTERSQCE